jgi:hypothetical protein
MNRWLVIGSLALVALAPRTAAAQADNSNAIVEFERARVVATVDDAARALTRWLRDDPPRRERLHVFAEGLTAAELGLLYGGEFGVGEAAEWPALPTP